jgi:DNA topoisomerase IA
VLSPAAFRKFITDEVKKMAKVIRAAKAKPNGEYTRLYAAAVARRQADQIYNLSLTRTATVIRVKGRGASSALAA